MAFDITEIKGVIPAMLTFFDSEENVDEQRTRNMVEFMIGANIGGLYLTGSTGACFTMTLEERKKVVEIVIDQVKGRVPVIVHVGDIGTQKSIELAQHAESSGADAISSVPPFYWRFSEDEIFGYYKDIAESTNIPMIVYNIQLAGIMDKSLIIKLAKIKNVQGLKFTARNHDEMGSIKAELGKDFMIYSGCDEMAFSGMAFGADGIIGSFYNVIPEIYKGICDAVATSNIPEGIRLQRIADEVIFLALQYGLPSSIYDMMRWRGLDAGYCKKPFRTNDEATLESFKSGFRAIRERLQAPELDIFKI